MSPARALAATLLLAALAALPATDARAQEAEEEAAAEEEDEGLGLNINLLASSIYNFYGVNQFAEERQLDQNVLFAPSITYTIPGVGLWLEYWSGYQARGANRQALIDEGTGNEQDFLVGYDVSFLDDALTLSGCLGVYLYPFADEEAAGTSFPAYLEPTVAVAWSTVVDLGLEIHYFAGLQDALEDYRYLYVRPFVSRTFELTDALGVVLGASYGVKLYNKFDEIDDNVHDVSDDVGVEAAAENGIYLVPAFHFAWTNLADLGFDEEYMVFGSLDLGVDL